MRNDGALIFNSVPPPLVRIHARETFHFIHDQSIVPHPAILGDTHCSHGQSISPSSRPNTRRLRGRRDGGQAAPGVGDIRGLLAGVCVCVSTRTCLNRRFRRLRDFAGGDTEADSHPFPFVYRDVHGRCGVMSRPLGAVNGLGGEFAATLFSLLLPREKGRESVWVCARKCGLGSWLFQTARRTRKYRHDCDGASSDKRRRDSRSIRRVYIFYDCRCYNHRVSTIKERATAIE